MRIGSSKIYGKLDPIASLGVRCYDVYERYEHLPPSDETHIGKVYRVAPGAHDFQRSQPWRNTRGDRAWRTKSGAMLGLWLSWVDAGSPRPS